MKNVKNLLPHIIGVFLFLLLLLPSCSLAADDNKETVSDLLKSRQADCWIEGEIFGDLILGTRGAVHFVYLDEKLSLALRKEDRTAPWVDDMNQYYGSPGTKKKALFLVQLEVNKPWDVSIDKFVVGSYHPNKNDVLTPSWTNPFGALDAGTTWQFAFVVPETVLKKGQEVELGYGDYTVKWKVPK